ncbi:NADH dehydrogenase [ubiquinone] 1 alpha subcomplex subunit 5-like [Rhodnius prolixus]|uniref:Putative nadh:ubiquinone oxidoreductase n=1 Tax=Rhodnius prolixus TaxID=13249 RepID=R4G3K3_RHOPR
MSKILAVTKKATGLTGLAVSKNPVHTLNVLYGKILRALEKIPQEAAYRKTTEQIVSARLAIVNAAKSVEEIEEKVDCGQVEELIIQAENELSLTRNMTVWRAWEAPTTDVPPNQWTWPPAKLPKS